MSKVFRLSSLIAIAIAIQPFISRFLSPPKIVPDTVFSSKIVFFFFLSHSSKLAFYDVLTSSVEC